MNRNLGVGVSYRPEFSGYLETLRGEVDLFEVVVDSCRTTIAIEDALDSISESHPLIMHGLHMSLGSVDPPPVMEMEHLERVAARYRPKIFSEHLSFFRAGEFDLPTFASLPRTDESVEALSANIKRLRTEVPSIQEIALENIAHYFAWPSDQWGEAEFTTRVLEETGAGLLLDINNLFVNAVNFKFDPYLFIREIPGHRVSYLHIAGHSRAKDGFLIDSHDRRIVPEVWSLAEEALRRTSARAMILERDNGSASEKELMDELSAAKTLWRRFR